MQNLQSRTKSSGQFIVSLRSELRDFSHCDRRQKQQEEPCRAADISADMRPEEPRNDCHCQHDQRGDAPAVIRRTGPPGTGQDEQRRSDRKEKKNVIEIQFEMGKSA